MRKVIQEVDLLFKTIAKTLESAAHHFSLLPLLFWSSSPTHSLSLGQRRTQEYEVNDPSVACGLVVHHQSLLRNKRCALAYL